MRWYSAPRIDATVEAGLVLCPVQRREVSADGCLTCRFLSEASVDEAGRLSEIVCEPAYQALARV